MNLYFSHHFLEFTFQSRIQNYLQLVGQPHTCNYDQEWESSSLYELEKKRKE